MAPPETKKEVVVEKTIGQEIASAMKEAMPAMIQSTILAMEMAKQQNVHDINMKAIKAKMALDEKCHICLQSVGDGKGRGCGGPWKRDANGDFLTDKEGRRTEDYNQSHVQMVVFPNDPIAVQQFDGVTINGAHYRSSGPDHKVWVPRNNNIAAVLLKFEEDQRIQQVGRKFMRQSGSIGRGGQQVNNPTFT